MNWNTIQGWKEWASKFPVISAGQPYKSPFILNRSQPETELLIYGPIGNDLLGEDKNATEELVEILAGIDPKSVLHVGIDSPGGNVFTGTAIHNLLERRGNVITRNDGLAASIASLILQAGDKRTAAATSQVMIHCAWGAFIGNARDGKSFTDALESCDKLISENYARRSGRKASEFMKLMEKETRFSAAEAKEAGLLDEVLEPKRNFRGHSCEPNQTSASGANNAHAVAPIISAATTEAGGSRPTPPTPPPTTTMSTPNTAEAPTPATPANDFAPVIAAINALGEKITNMTTTANSLPGAAPVTVRVENLGNPLIERYNNLAHDKVEQAKLAKGSYNELRKQMFIANGLKELGSNYDRFDFGTGKIMNANTVDSALANTILSGEFVTTMRSYIAPWGAWTRTVSLSPISRRQVLEVPLASSSGSKQQNATDYESGNSTLAPIAVTVAEESKSFHTSRPETNLGLQLAALVPTNAAVLAEGINTKMTALITTANFGAATTIGAASSFDSADLPAILALGKNYRQVRLVLDGGHLAYLLPTTREHFAFGEPGAFGFDGGIFKNNLWTSATANTVGFVCGPDAIVNGWGMADGLPSGEAISQSTVDVNGIPFGLSVWFSRKTREVWASFQVMHGCAVGDATQGELLVTS